MTSSAPLVSVLMPCHNCETTLPRALDSLQGQSFAHFEILAVNNGSTDATPDLLTSFAGRDPRMRVFHLEQAGIVAALNYGLDRARGEYVARMDADDRCLPARFEDQVRYLQTHAHIGVVSGLVRHLDPCGFFGRADYVQWLNSLQSPEECALHRFVECPLAHPSLMFRRHLPTSLGPYRQGPFAEDYELLLRWAEQGVAMAKVPRTVLEWQDGPDRLSRTDPRCSQEAMYRLKSPFLARWLRKHNPFHPGVFILGAGRRSRTRVQWLEQEGIRIQAYVDVDPAKIGGSVRGRPVIPVHDLPRPGQGFCLSYVGQKGMRAKVTSFLQDKGYTLGRDFLLAA